MQSLNFFPQLLVVEIGLVLEFLLEIYYFFQIVSINIPFSYGFAQQLFLVRFFTLQAFDV